MDLRERFVSAARMESIGEADFDHDLKKPEELYVFLLRVRNRLRGDIDQIQPQAEAGWLDRAQAEKLKALVEQHTRISNLLTFYHLCWDPAGSVFSGLNRRAG